MDARTEQVHGSARLKCHTETETQTLPSLDREGEVRPTV